MRDRSAPSGGRASSARSIRTFHSPFIGASRWEPSTAWTASANCFCPIWSGIRTSNRSCSGGAGLALAASSSSLAATVGLSRPAREVGPEQVPVAGQPELGRGLLQELHRLGLARTPVGGAGRCQVGPVGQGLRQAELQVLAEGRPVADGRHGAQSHDRIVEQGDGSLADLRIARLEQRGLPPGLRLRPSEDRGLEPELPRQGQVRVLPGESVEQVDRLGPPMTADLGIGHRLRRAIERRGHVQHQLLATDRIDRRIGDLGADDRQVLRQLGIAERLLSHGSRRDDQRTPESSRHGPLLTPIRDRSSPSSVYQDRDLLGYGVLGLGVEEDRQDHRGQQARQPSGPGTVCGSR